MFVTRQMDYGLRILLTLGCRPAERLTGDILAREIGVTREFTLKTISALRRADLVKAWRGVGGGVELSRPPADISIHEIFIATGSRRALNPCLLEPRKCERSSRCAAHRVLGHIQNLVDAELQKCTLADLVREQKLLNAAT